MGNAEKESFHIRTDIPMTKLIWIILSATISSCMHVMMQLHASHDQPGGGTLQRTVVTHGVQFKAEFPELVDGGEKHATLRLTDHVNSTAISRAGVAFRVYPVMHLDGHADHPTGEYSIPVEIRDSGLFVATFSAPKSGEYLLSFRIHSISDVPLEQPVIIEERLVAEGEMNQHGDRSEEVGPYLIAGGIAMAVMMIGMIVIRGGVF
jgi:hypothetical protein